MKKFPLILILCLSSCAYATKEKVVMLGGKGAYRSKEFSMVYNGERSFRDGALAVTTVAATVASAVTQAAAETTAQVSSTNAANVTAEQIKGSTATAITNSNNATKVSLKALEVAPK
jgi:hypothetical protein